MRDGESSLFVKQMKGVTWLVSPTACHSRPPSLRQPIPPSLPPSVSPSLTHSLTLLVPLCSYLSSYFLTFSLFLFSHFFLPPSHFFPISLSQNPSPSIAPWFPSIHLTPLMSVHNFATHSVHKSRYLCDVCLLSCSPRKLRKFPSRDIFVLKFYSHDVIVLKKINKKLSIVCTFPRLIHSLPFTHYYPNPSTPPTFKCCNFSASLCIFT